MDQQLNGLPVRAHEAKKCRPARTNGAILTRSPFGVQNRSSFGTKGGLHTVARKALKGGHVVSCGRGARIKLAFFGKTLAAALALSTALSVTGPVHGDGRAPVTHIAAADETGPQESN